MRVTSLGSGSKGNATVIAEGETRILIDSGFSCRALEKRLAQRGLSGQDITAVLVTHEHSDHFNGVPTFANRYQIPVWMTHGTSLHEKVAKVKRLEVFNSHQAFEIESIQVHPVLVPHDSREACQFVLENQDKRVGILTDLGHITPFVSQHYQDCDALLLEFNHDRQMLMSGRYPPALKSRVGGSLGHLSNEQALDFLNSTEFSNLKFIAGMHLSEENNCRSKVNEALLNFAQGKMVTQVACQENGFDWIEL